MNHNILLIFFSFVPLLFGARFKLIDKIDYRFKKIGIEQGLSQSSILSIEQDKRGYMWFGTASGLNRYDGYEFIVYVNNNDDSLSLSSNEISALYEDSDGYLWVGTTQGVLNKFDPKTENFIHFDIARTSDWYISDENDFSNYPLSFSRHSSSTITSIVGGDNGDLWIGTWGKGIVHFNPRSGQKKYYYHFRNRSNSLSSNKVTELLTDSKNNIWIGTFGGGLNRIKIAENDSILIENINKKLNFDFGERITALLEDSKHNIWVGSYSGNVSQIKNIDNKTDNNAKFETRSLKNKFMPIDGNNIISVMSITEDANYNVWLGSYGDGLYSYSLKTEEIKHFVNELNNPNSLSDNEIQSLYVDNSGILWIGTQLGSGINKLEMGVHKFNTIPILTENNQSLNDKIVWAIFEDSNNDLWIGTHRGGINLWDRKSDRFKYFKKDKNLADNHIRSFIEDSKGNIWIGTYSGGLSFYERNTSSFIDIMQRVPLDNALSGNQVQELFIEEDSTLWVGTFDGGLNKLNLNKFYMTGIPSFRTYIHNPGDNNSISDNRVYTIFKDSQDMFWIGTHGGGLNRLDQKTEIFYKYQSQPDKKSTLSDNRVLVIHEIENGNLLIGTFGGGLNLYNRKEDNFERLSQSNFNFSDVYGILSDNSGYWLSTDNGIFKINLDLNSVTQFDLSDGLQSLEFSGGAYLRGSDGTFYFGGINGINYFNPINIKLDEFIPPIVISSIKVFDKPIRGEKEFLVFDLDENYFSFEFASLDFRNSNKNKYKFMMEGFDTKWSYTDAGNRKVFYTNLSSGNYKFKVMGTNNDGLWSSKEASAEITILTPFWMRWWFISGLILALGGLVTFFINQRIRYLVALDKLKTNIAADLHDNVGAGLTEISILSELASNEIEKPNTASRHLEQISDLSRQLVESMSDIVWVVNPTRDSLYDLIVRLKDAYGELLFDLGIKLQTSNLEKLNDIKLPMDYRQNLYLILKEALNNCIKHSKCSIIDLKVKVVKNRLFIKFIDNGIGFNSQNTGSGNGLVNIRERGDKIGGKINIISNINEGTTIEFEGEVIR